MLKQIKKNIEKQIKKKTIDENILDRISEKRMTKIIEHYLKVKNKTWYYIPECT